MFQRRQRRFRRRPNDRNNMLRGNGSGLIQLRSNSFSNNPVRNKFKTTLGAEKLFEKYNALAKEALSSGDKTLSENYLQHADHFARIINDKNKNQNQHKPNFINKSPEHDKQLSNNGDTKQDQAIDNKQDQAIDNKQDQASDNKE